MVARLNELHVDCYLIFNAPSTALYDIVDVQLPADSIYILAAGLVVHGRSPGDDGESLRRQTCQRRNDLVGHRVAEIVLSGKLWAADRER